eukprot:gene3245-biopygen1870
MAAMNTSHPPAVTATMAALHAKRPAAQLPSTSPSQPHMNMNRRILFKDLPLKAESDVVSPVVHTAGARVGRVAVILGLFAARRPRRQGPQPLRALQEREGDGQGGALLRQHTADLGQDRSGDAGDGGHRLADVQ